VFVAPAKTLERQWARIARQELGMSVKRIADAFHVSPSSVSSWVRDIELSPEQEAALRDMAARQLKGVEQRAAKARARRAAAQHRGRAIARGSDPLHQAGCMLFWAEGARNRNSVVFANSDVAMHQYFRRFLRECYAVPDERIVLSINCFLGNGKAVEEIENWWLAQLDLPRSCLRPTIVNRPSRASKGTHRVLVHGTARLVVHSTEIVQSVYGAIQEYTGVDRPEWLDLPTRGRRPGTLPE
jgi:DNA-binding transcriptional regulator YiaG